MSDVVVKDSDTPAVPYSIDPQQVYNDYVRGIIFNGIRIMPTARQLAEYYGNRGLESEILDIVKEYRLDLERYQYVTRSKLKYHEYHKFMKRMTNSEVYETASHMRTMLRSAMMSGDFGATLMMGKLAALWTEMAMKIDEKDEEGYSKWQELWTSLFKDKE